MTRPMRDALAALDARFDVAEHTVQLAGHTVVLEKPRNRDKLISEEDYARDERLPYWADLWPAATALANVIAAPPPGLEWPHAAGARPRTLELGCGLGLVTVAAIRAGLDVTATDYYEDALHFTARNALTNTGVEPTLRMVDWRTLPDDLGTYDVVLAADVLYERPHAALVAATVLRTLAPGGRMLLADQGRTALKAFLKKTTAGGLTHRTVHVAPTPAPADAPENSCLAPIGIYELRHA